MTLFSSVSKNIHFFPSLKIYLIFPAPSEKKKRLIIIHMKVCQNVETEKLKVICALLSVVLNVQSGNSSSCT